MAKEKFHLRVNGRQEAVNASGETPLLYLLRNDLGLKGTRFGCGTGDCGSCMVLLDGVAEKSCQTPVGSAGKGRSRQSRGWQEGRACPHCSRRFSTSRQANAVTAFRGSSSPAPVCCAPALRPRKPRFARHSTAISVAAAATPGSSPRCCARR